MRDYSTFARETSFVCQKGRKRELKSPNWSAQDVKWLQAQKSNFPHQTPSCFKRTEILAITETLTTRFKGVNMQHITTQPRTTAITRNHQAVFKKSAFIVALSALGGITIVGGIITLVSAIILLLDATLPSLARSILTNAVVDITIGTLLITSSRAFAKGKILAIWFLGGSLLFDSIYSLLMGYQLHYILMGFGFLLIWQMLKFKKEWATP
jgi:hypothetical protein